MPHLVDGVHGEDVGVCHPLPDDDHEPAELVVAAHREDDAGLQRAPDLRQPRVPVTEPARQQRPR